MRLIDADKLLNDYQELADCDFVHPLYEDTLRDIVDDAPTVEMAEDCVKRDDAQDIMARLLSDYLHDEDREKIENANAEIGELPSVQPQPKRGHWIVIRKEYEFMGGIVNESQGCKCSNCGGIVKFKSDFCPSCGVDMRGE